MVVTDDALAEVRAWLAGLAPQEDWSRSQLDVSVLRGYRLLVAAAFFEAVARRFGPAVLAAEVTEHISRLRSGSDLLARHLDSRSAERLILSVSTGEDTADIGLAASFEAEVLLLVALVAEAGMDGEALDQLLGRARAAADQQLAAAAPPG